MTTTKTRVAISISESDDLRELGMGIMHLQDALVETARQVLRKGYALAYGGNLNYQGEYNFSELLNLIAHSYSNTLCIHHYVAYPMQMQITSKQRADLGDRGEIVLVAPGGYASLLNLSYETASEVQKKQIDALLYGDEAEELRRSALTAMRDLMAEQTAIRIIMGGKIPKSGNKKPGILEEALASLKNNCSLIIDGRFGGAAKMIIDAIVYQKVDERYKAMLNDVIERSTPRYEIVGDILFIRGKANIDDFRNINLWT